VLAIENLAFDIMDTWQARCLKSARGQTAMVLLSILSHAYDEALIPVLLLVFPGFIEPSLPCLCSAARIGKTGAIIADVITRDGYVQQGMWIYKSETVLRDDFRSLADRVDLSDVDRRELFICINKWIVADQRLDPNFDRRDPDAKRILN
jgi:hypothetical protein